MANDRNESWRLTPFERWVQDESNWVAFPHH